MAAFFHFSKPNVSHVPARSFCHFHAKLSSVWYTLFQIEILLHTAYFDKETENDVM
jgi:hypothetical protein